MPGIIQNWLQNKLKHFPWQIIIVSVSQLPLGQIGAANVTWPGSTIVRIK